jgi:hypothetical protein
VLCPYSLGFLLNSSRISPYFIPRTNLGRTAFRRPQLHFHCMGWARKLSFQFSKSSLQTQKTVFPTLAGAAGSESPLSLYRAEHSSSASLCSPSLVSCVCDSHCMFVLPVSAISSPRVILIHRRCRVFSFAVLPSLRPPSPVSPGWMDLPMPIENNSISWMEQRHGH